MNFSIQPSSYTAGETQSVRLQERHTAEPKEIICAGLKLKIHPGVYGTSADTELMIDTVEINKNETFLEIGCGSGAVSIAIAKRAKSGIGVDVNELAVANSQFNAERHQANNLQLLRSDLFEKISDKFDVIIFNPPYNDYEPSDDIDKMFWDGNNEIKRRFFQEASNYLKDNGKIYFGWANFSDLDLDLPFRLAQENKLEVIGLKSKASPNGKCAFYVLTIQPTKTVK